MSSTTHHKLLIDASSRQGEGLCGVLSRILQAATPDVFDFTDVTLVVPPDNTIDWPDVSWLEIVRAAAHASDGVESFTAVQQQLDKEPQTALMSLNTVRFSHERSVVFMNDAASSTLSHDAVVGGFLQRLKEKITARAQMPQLEGAISKVSSLSGVGAVVGPTLESYQNKFKSNTVKRNNSMKLPCNPT